MMYREDKSLTPDQQVLKWAIYCELEFSSDSDIKTVLESLLKDLTDA